MRHRNRDPGQPTPTPQVKMVQSTSPHANQHFVRTKLRLAHFGITQYFEPAVCRKEDRFHRSFVLLEMAPDPNVTTASRLSFPAPPAGRQMSTRMPAKDSSGRTASHISSQAKWRYRAQAKRRR